MSENTYTLFATFRVSSSHPVVFDGHDVPETVQELEDVVGLIGDEDVTVRGWYDVSGMRADADIMVCLQGSAAEDVQWSLRELRRTTLLRSLIRTWGTIYLEDDEQAPPLGDEAQSWVALRPSGPLEYPDVREADSITELIGALNDDETTGGRHAGKRRAAAYVGRLIEAFELVEVLQ
ncbi:chlorite dismutase family protein [Leucobacter sp. gxy201]|uniref:chlorite dismutase family protein n=1 Tax=Leucobacter sp. gxy201 TaxID=2957200 RepID=UPI003DA01BFD